MFLSDTWVSSTVLCLYTDASSIGFSGYRYLGNNWFADKWPVAWEKFHITFKELFPIVLAVEFWADKMKNHCINFFSDNEAVVYIL